MDTFFPEIEISDEQAEAIARGLFAVARAEGGVHEKEKALLMSFYADAAGGTRSLAELERAADATPEEIAAALTTSALRNVFIKTCILMAWADNSFDGKERELVNRYAKVLGISDAEVAEHESAVKSYLVSSIVTLANVDAVVDVAKKLG
ncbi:MAG: TerB family tellurite resistance protein [Acidobacteria bacterium]|nr:TerB family tellurite resistance protein [Acidobacteriota bacterium]